MLNRSSEKPSILILHKARLSSDEVLQFFDVERNPKRRSVIPHNVPTGLTPQEVKQLLEEIRAFIGENRRRLDVVATTRTRSGQEVDWIRPESQNNGGSGQGFGIGTVGRQVIEALLALASPRRPWKQDVAAPQASRPHRWASMKSRKIERQSADTTG